MKKRMKMKRYAEGDAVEVDYDRDYDPEAQKVYSSRGRGASYSDEEDGGLYEVTREAPKKAAAKPAPRKQSPVNDRREFSRLPDKKQKPLSWAVAREFKPYKKGGSIKSSASRRADGIAQRGKTKGRMV